MYFILLVAGRTGPAPKPLLPGHGRIHAVFLSGAAGVVRVGQHSLGRGTAFAGGANNSGGHPGGLVPRGGDPAVSAAPGTEPRRTDPRARPGPEAQRSLHRDLGAHLQPAQGGL